MRIVAVLALAACGRFDFAPLQDGPRDVVTTADAFQAPSCVGLAPTCGASDDCCKSLPVPGGMFARSHDVADDAVYADAQYVATLPAFQLDKYEVTVARFRAFVDAGFPKPAAGAGTHASIANSGWSATFDASYPANRAAVETMLVCDSGGSWTTTPGAKESAPVSCVTWYVALAFCAWDGGYLPTEAEWNFAAAGGDEQRAYPWSIPPSSTTLDDSHAVYNGAAYTPVGSKPAGDGKWGHSDLAGSVWEWTLDHWATPYPQNPCDGCANLTGTNWVVRGGSLADGAANLRTAIRDRDGSVQPNDRDSDIGFRCARPN